MTTENNSGADRTATKRGVQAKRGRLARGTTARTASTAKTVTNWHDLNEVREEFAEDYVLQADLDATTDGYGEHVDSGDGWEPLGDEDEPFTGTFDGNGYQSADLVIDRDDEIYVGLFAVTSGTIENVVLTSSDVTGDTGVGTLAGYLVDEAVITESYATGEVTGTSAVGGLVGLDGPDVEAVTIAQSGAAVDVTCEDTGGGLAGGLDAGSEVTNSFATGDVTGTVGNPLGGLLGSLAGEEAEANVTESFATGDVVADPDMASNVGGLIGVANFDAIVTDSYATGDVTAFQLVGGLIGFVGEDSVATRSYATGTVSGGDFATSIGGLVGMLSGTLTESYWDTESTDQDEAVGDEVDGPTLDATGLETAAMQGVSAETNMDDLDFEDTWSVVADPDCYPKLQWQQTDADSFLAATVDSRPVGIDEEATILVEAGEVTRLSLDALWTDWVITTVDASGDPDVDPAEGETPDDGTLELSWDECVRGSVAATVGVTLNEDVEPRYVGGDYLVDVSTTSGEHARTVTIELDSD